MPFVPYENLYIISKLPPAEIQLRLEKVVSRPDNSFRGLFSKSPDTPFSGYVSGNLSLFKPNINYRNSFIPEIKLQTEPYLDGSRIHVKMKLLDFVFAFLCLWMSGAAIGCIATIIVVLSGSNPVAIIFIPFGMLGFGYLLTTGGFKAESTDARSVLLKLFEGEIETPQK
jgi:hypothetical protein